ncbi:MAG: hypothetical protein ACI8VJ_000782 [Polaribacter sp.]|jgi:hypothetical protein
MWLFLIYSNINKQADLKMYFCQHSTKTKNNEFTTRFRE